ncbi:CST, telomere maintenance, complex subunit CTC1-domain-containing protein [Glomus cerebriforme]|uniref:CST complex subunit CTC1 n=1 Tax=Glomus cerebriforme TaxID=658196 RepID=A0A397TLA3_9GLOM|nr:CST, telomere maintenance, complex subunit CTC1-domain-containing protein [Glomus cerebriforme]
MTQYPRYHRWFLSELIMNKRCITPLANTIVLLGTLQLITKDNTKYPKGTILFEDETGKVPCLLIGYEKDWFIGTIALLSWSFLINKQQTGKEVCHLEVHSEIFFLRVGVSEVLRSKKLTLYSNFLEKRNRSYFLDRNLFQQSKSLVTTADMLINLSRNSTEFLPNVNLIAMVNMKSVLYQSEDEIAFIVTLNEVHDPRSFIHIIFNGDHFIEYYKIIMVGEIYIFKNMKPRSFNEKTLQSAAFEISSIDSIEYSNRKLAIAYNSSNLAEQTQNSIDLTYSCFGYEGIITCIIDNALGLFVLDSEYILHLGKYPEYNPSITPYRLGMKLLLHNIHAIKFSMDKDIWKLDNHKYCPDFRNVKAIFAACHCSTIQVIRFPSEIFEPDSGLQKIIGKFSNFRNNNSFTLLELIWVQKVYYDITKKFPNEFEDQTLLSDPRPSKSDYKKVENCPFSRLLRTYRITNHFKDLAREYFNHKISCHITEDNQEIDIRLPPISEVLQFINELVTTQQRFSSEIYGEAQLKVISQFEAKLEKTHLMGVLEGSLDGTLQLKDQTGKVSVINISFEKIQTHHLNNVWIIPEYELVVEQPNKIYLRFAIEKCFCFYAKSHDPQFHSNQSIFQVRHIFPTKLKYSSDSLTPKMNCKLQIEIIEYQSDLISNNALTFINLSNDFIKILPAMHIGLFYVLSFDKSKFEQIVNSKERLITLKFDDFATANIINLQFDDSSTFKDLFGHVIQPKILKLNESSKITFKNLKTAFLMEDKQLNVQEILNENLINSLNEMNKPVSLKGLIVSKEIQHTNVGQSKASLLLKIQDIQGDEIVDIYISNISKYVIPIGLIPGQIIILRKVEPKKSFLGNIYCYASEITHISLHGYPKAIRSFHQDLDNTILIDLFENRMSIQSIFRVPCRINTIYEIIMQFVCEACERIIENNFCPNGCNLGQRLYSSSKFKISDGTCNATVTARGDIVIRELLCIGNDSYEKICNQIGKSRFFYEWNIFNDNCYIKKSLSDFTSLKDIRRDVILFCKKKNMEQSPSILELNAIKIAEKSSIFELERKLNL